jgi:sensor histidine kinase YesM
MFLTLSSNQKLYEWTEKAVQRGVAYHIFFWIVFFLFLVIIDTNESLSTRMINMALRMVFYIIVVYSNLNFLFPRFLKKNNFFVYIILLVLLVILVTPLEVISSYYLIPTEFTSISQVFTFKVLSSFFLGTFFIAFSSSIFKIINDWIDNQNERVDLQRQNLTSELKYLKTQINPHFFFNTLNSLYALTLKKSDKAPEIVLKLSEMMRYMLYESNERTIELTKEINYIQNYLELEKIRHGDHVKIDFNLKGDPNGHMIAPLLFIPFFENTFKHGLDHELKKGYVDILLDITDRDVSLTVKNSKPEKVIVSNEKKVGGIGLTNVRRRLNILYPGKYKLNIEDTETIFSVLLILKGTKKHI